MVKTQVVIRLSVPRPGDSGTQPTNGVAVAVGDGLELHPKQAVASIEAYFLYRLIEYLIRHLWVLTTQRMLL